MYFRLFFLFDSWLKFASNFFFRQLISFRSSVYSINNTNKSSFDIKVRIEIKVMKFGALISLIYGDIKNTLWKI